MEEAVMHAMGKLAADRFATAAQSAEALAGNGPTTSSRASGSVAANAARNSVWRRRFQLASTVALLAIGVSGWLWIRGRNVGDQPVERRYVSLGDSAQVQYNDVRGPAVALSPGGGILAFASRKLGSECTFTR